MRSHGGEGFQGDLSLAMQQAAERDPTPEETHEERMYRQAYEAEQAQARDSERVAQAEAQRTAREQAVANKRAQDAADEHRADASNYKYGEDGTLFYMGPQGRVYRVDPAGRRVPATGRTPFSKTNDKSELDAAFAKSKSRKTNSALRW